MSNASGQWHVSATGVRRRGLGAFCRGCGKWFVARVSQRRRGWDYYCGRPCSQRANGEKFTGQGFTGGSGSYVKYRGNREHRFVAEAALGRPLLTTEHVHHVDGDKANNDPANLVVVLPGEHLKIHWGNTGVGLNLQGILCTVEGDNIRVGGQ